MYVLLPALGGGGGVKIPIMYVFVTYLILEHIFELNKYYYTVKDGTRSILYIIARII